MATDHPGFGQYGYYCMLYKEAQVCFQAHDDVIFVDDEKKDGHESWVEWEIPGEREGQCITRLGYHHWGYCNKNFPENKFINFRIYYNGDYKEATWTT
ncbi:hypothetical protein ABT052_00740 [Streptomyces sp. NPDC002766]|uniref:hypothetical protein n=1 Tax=Streptomyces sp. NPDC002766 TaxID=3154429 RepID=UPI00332A1F00